MSARCCSVPGLNAVRAQLSSSSDRFQALGERLGNTDGEVGCYRESETSGSKHEKQPDASRQGPHGEGLDFAP